MRRWLLVGGATVAWAMLAGGVVRGQVAGREGTAYVAPSDEEQLSRALLELKSERAAAAGKYGADDGKVREIDARLAELKAKIAARGAEFADVPAEGGSGGAGPMVYPRIVQEEYVAPALPAAGAVVPRDAGAGGVTALSQDSAENVAARRALGQTQTTFVLEAVGLEKFIAQLREQTHANLWVNWTALATVNVDRNTPVTLTLAQVSGERALNMALSQVGGGTANLAFTVDGGIVTVSTKEDLSSSKYQEVRVLDVRDLLVVDGSYPAQYAVQVYGGMVNGLVDTIRSTVASDTWKDSGGTIGSIRELNGMLIINQTADNLRAIELLLAKLRRRG